MSFDFIEHALIEKAADVLAYGARERKCNIYQLAAAWLASETYDSLINFDVRLCSQSAYYIFNKFENELKTYDVSIIVDENSPEYEDDIFWFGYLVAYWHMLENITGQEIFEKYDIVDIIHAYDPYHMLSILQAIERIKEESKR